MTPETSVSKYEIQARVAVHRDGKFAYWTKAAIAASLCEARLAKRKDKESIELPSEVQVEMPTPRHLRCSLAASRLDSTTADIPRRIKIARPGRPASFGLIQGRPGSCGTWTFRDAVMLMSELEAIDARMRGLFKANVLSRMSDQRRIEDMDDAIAVSVSMDPDFELSHYSKLQSDRSGRHSVETRGGKAYPWKTRAGIPDQATCSTVKQARIRTKPTKRKVNRMYSVPSEVNDQRLQDRWFDVGQGVECGELNWGDALRMMVAIYDTPRLIQRRDESSAD